MRLLLDTHVVLWAASAPERLGDAAALVLEAEERWLSAASTWEMAIKQGLGKLSLGMSAGAWTARAVTELALRPLPVTSAHAAGVEGLPSHHRDPFDRLLVAQAAAEGLVLLTADRALEPYGDVVRLLRLDP